MLDNITPLKLLNKMIDNGTIKYPFEKEFFSMLQRVSGKKFPCDERAARSLYCGQLWADIGDMVESRQNESEDMAILFEAVDKFAVCYDYFFDQAIERYQPVCLSFGQKGYVFREYGEEDEDDESKGKRYWYYPKNQAHMIISNVLKDKFSNSQIKNLLSSIENGLMPLTIICDNNKHEFSCEPCFNNQFRTKRFSGRGNPDMIEINKILNGRTASKSN